MILIMFTEGDFTPHYSHFIAKSKQATGDLQLIAEIDKYGDTIAKPFRGVNKQSVSLIECN